VLQQYTQILRGVDLFSSLSDEQIKLLGRCFQKRIIPRDQLVILENDDSDSSLFIIVKGAVKVFLSGAQGREAILALLGRGDFFGEMSLLDGEPRSASVRTTEQTELLTLKQEDFYKELKKQPELCFSLLAELSRRLRKANKQITSLALSSVWGRVADTLLKLSEEKGIRTKTIQGKSCIVIRGKPSQQQFAEMSGTTRETVSRIFALMQKKEIIALVGKDLYIFQEKNIKFSEL